MSALTVLLLALGLATTPALAKPAKAAKRKPAAEEEAPKTNTVFKKKEKLEFSGFKLKGQLKKPDLSYIYKRRGLRAEQIVNIPENFNEEIIQGENQF